MGQKQHISTAEDMKLREMLLSPQNKVEDTRNEKMDVRSYCSLKYFYHCGIDCQSCCDGYATGTFRTDDGGCDINVLLY